MITKVKIAHFKGFKELGLSDLSRITLLGGRNNLGKTSALEAIFLFFDRLNAGMFFRHLNWRGIGNISLDPETVCAPLFYHYNLDQKIVLSIWDDCNQQTMEFAFTLTNPQKSIEVGSSRLDERALPELTSGLAAFGLYGIDITYRFAQTELKARWSILPKPDSSAIAVQLAPETPEQYVNTVTKPAVLLSARTRVPPEEDVQRFGRLDNEVKGDTPVQFLQILEPRLKSLSIGSNRIIQGDIGIGHKLPVPLMGEGMDRLLSLILVIATTRQGIVFIDEFENGIHHSVLSKVWEAVARSAREFDCQIIATTHSYECLQAAYEGVAAADSSNELRYIRLDRRGEEIIATPYKYEELGAALENRWELR